MLFFQRFARSAVILTAMLGFSFAGMLAADAQQTVGIVVNGSQINLYPAPIEQGGRVFVPLRGVFERLGATVVYSNGQIDATGANGQEIQLSIGSTQATVNGQTETVDVAPFLIGARTYVPLRFVSEALGASVNWDPSDQVVSISTGSAPQAYNGQQNNDQYAQYADQAPPPLPVYQQPYVPEPNYIWQPGYWALGEYGYYWVPGTWVPAPQPGYLWTPPYWAFQSGGFHFISGFWATAVGFYGGINYGGGYNGNGYYGGHWSGDQFAYNRAVTNVNTTTINNTYIDKTVVNNYYTTPQTSYVGGTGGLQAHPNAQQLVVARASHLGLTQVQQQHIAAAASNRLLLATVNHNTPPVVTVQKPLSPSAPQEKFAPITPSDRAALKAPAPAAIHPGPAFNAGPAAAPVHTAAPYHAPVNPAPEYRAPVHTAAPVPLERPVPAYHAPIHTAAPAPLVRPAPLYHAPVHTPIPYHPQIVHPAPAYHPQPVHTPAPQVHAPPKPPHATPHPHPTDNPDDKPHG